MCLAEQTNVYENVTCMYACMGVWVHAYAYAYIHANAVDVYSSRGPFNPSSTKYDAEPCQNKRRCN